jgi:predicted translin family RNA/ssDNA-binding protein
MQDIEDYLQGFCDSEYMKGFADYIGEGLRRRA